MFPRISKDLNGQEPTEGSDQTTAESILLPVEGQQERRASAAMGIHDFDGDNHTSVRCADGKTISTKLQDPQQVLADINQVRDTFLAAPPSDSKHSTGSASSRQTDRAKPKGPQRVITNSANKGKNKDKDGACCAGPGDSSKDCVIF